MRRFPRLADEFMLAYIARWRNLVNVNAHAIRGSNEAPIV
jgi:hypothetical protein